MITTEMIKELRIKTSAGVMVCKKTLAKTNGDMNKALELLKEQEAALAAKKAERSTSEGLIGVYVSDDKKTGALAEINCETDFVASNKDFVDLTNSIAQQIAVSSAYDVESLLREAYVNDSGSSVKDVITALIAKFGENINLTRFTKLSTESGGLHSYIHNGNKIGVLVELLCTKTGPAFEQAAKEVTMQVAATKPLFLNSENANQDTVEQEMQSYRNQALSEGKPETVIEKIVAGKINKFYKKNCLLEQPWIKNEDMTIAEFLKESSIKLDAHIEVVNFARFELGIS